MQISETRIKKNGNKIKLAAIFRSTSKLNTSLDYWKSDAYLEPQPKTRCYTFMLINAVINNINDESNQHQNSKKSMNLWCYIKVSPTFSIILGIEVNDNPLNKINDWLTLYFFSIFTGRQNLEMIR